MCRYLTPVTPRPCVSRFRHTASSLAWLMLVYTRIPTAAGCDIGETKGWQLCCWLCTSSYSFDSAATATTIIETTCRSWKKAEHYSTRCRFKGTQRITRWSSLRTTITTSTTLQSSSSLSSVADTSMTQLLHLILLEASPDFIHVIFFKGSFLYVAPRVRKVLGY